MKITVPSVGDTRFKQWAKILERVDVSKDNGYAFIGEFVSLGDLIEVPEGTHILAYGEYGSRKFRDPLVVLYEVTEDGLKKVYEKTGLNRRWALEVRDDIAQIVNGQDVSPRLLSAWRAYQALTEEEKQAFRKAVETGSLE